MAVQSAPLGSDRHWLALAVNVVSQFMVVLDTAIVNVALPWIKSDLHFSPENLQRVITGYAICFGGVLAVSNVSALFAGAVIVSQFLLLTLCVTRPSKREWSTSP